MRTSDRKKLGQYLAGAVLAAAMSVGVLPAADLRGEQVTVIRVPNDGIQPQVGVDEAGTIHLVYFKGDPKQGDLFYVRSTNGGASFSEPIRVNSQEGSAVAQGTIRGAQLALGRDGRVHVAWNGSSLAVPRGPLNPQQPRDSPYNGLPMLYTRLNYAVRAFEPQRNIMQRTFALDGGGSVAADGSGNVYVAWHGSDEKAGKGEGGRRVWVARSQDDGKSFAPEEPAFDEPTGACGCCGMRVFAGAGGSVFALYRSATRDVNRDIYLLVSQDRGRTFKGALLHRWEINACPMSSMAFTEGPAGVIGAWETQGQIYFSAIDAAGLKASRIVAAPGNAEHRKYPSAATNVHGQMLLAWVEGAGWAKGGSLAWQVFDKDGRPAGDTRTRPGVPVWSFAAAFVRSDGTFAIMY